MVCVGGRYQLLGELGSGGTSTVFLAVDTVLHKQWAVKETLLQGDESYQKYIMQSLRAEVEVLKECDHPAIPRIVDFFEENGRAYAVRDYVKGRSLKSIVESQGLLNARTVRELGMQLCSVLSYLHSHYPPIVYGDLKPSHVMIADDGSVRLIDFGAATQLYVNSGAFALRGNNQANVRFATPQFSAPELFDENSSITASSDVYAIGMTLCYALLPGDSSDSKLQAACSSGDRELFDQLVAVLATATASHPSQRYKDCEAMFDALESLGKNSRQQNVTKNQSKRRSSRDSAKKIPRNTSCSRNYMLLNKKTFVILFALIAAAVFGLLICNCLGAINSNAAIRKTDIRKVDIRKADIRKADIKKADVRKSEIRKESKQATVVVKNIDVNSMQKSKSDFYSYIRLAERETSVEVAGKYIAKAMYLQNRMLEKHYVKKMSLRPMRVLLRLQTADQQWSSSEERSFMNLLKKYENKLRANTKDWPEFSGDIGKAYWYYFAGLSGKVDSSERISRMSVAKEWFRDAVKNSDYDEDNNSSRDLAATSAVRLKNIANKRIFNTYIAISEGYSRLVDVTQNSNNAETYKGYAQKLRQLIHIVKQYKEDDLSVDAGELVLQSLHMWMRTLKESGISESETKQLCDDALNVLEKANARNEEAEQRRKSALGSVKQINNEIIAVFRKK